MKKLFTLFILTLLPMLASADAIEIDGIYYNLDSEAKTAEVTSKPDRYKDDVIIPETVRYNETIYNVNTIGWAAFNNCSGLTSVTIPNSVTFIDNGAFYGCSGLTSVTIGSSVTSIGEWAFSGCIGLTSVKIPNSVTEIGDYAFQSCTSLTSITIPSSVTSIGKYSFFDCSGLKSIAVENGNPVYDSRESCKALIKTSDNELILGCMNSTIPNSVTRIGQAAFQNCKRLLSVRIPNSVVSVGQNAFQGCSGMTSITIPNSVTSIGEAAFRGCSGLTSITIPNSVTSIGEYVFYNCSGLTSVTIPNSVTFIGLCAFAYCSGLTSVTIPNSVTFIDNHAFQFCSGLTSITIGSGIITIGDQVFACCPELKDVYCYAKSVPYTYADSYSNAFIDSSIEYATLHVPAGSVSAYQAVKPWKNFKEIVALSNNSNTQDYFPEGTKWTEIRLDTLKYDSWFSKVGDEWVPNFETIEYYVQGDCPDRDWIYKKVYTNGPEWTDSLTLMIQEAHDSVLVSVLVHDYDGKSYVLWPGEAYQFDWSVGKGLYYENILMQNTTISFPHQYDYGIVDEIKEGYFGGVKPLKYVDLNGSRIIQGIGITEWNDGECLFGPPDPYSALKSYHWETYPKRHYRSMLVHFERNGEVLYDVWPEKGVTYRPFVEDGKVWKCGSTAGISDGIVKMVEYYYFDGDTIIDGKTCKQMMCQRYVSPNHPDYAAMSQNPSLRYVGAWYEEDKKVYIYNSTSKQFRMVYDFSLGDYDILPFLNYGGYPSLMIGPKQTGGLKGFKGVYRDVMYYVDGSSGYNTTWLEGVGGIDGPTVNFYYGKEGHGLFLMSCTVGDEVIYLNDEYEDGATPKDLEARKNRFDFTHTIKTKPKAPSKRGEEQMLYGEYNDLRLGINLNPLDDTYLVCITNESGEVVYEKTVNASAIVGLDIDISAYAKGRYTVTVENSVEAFTGLFETQTSGIEAISNQPSAVKHHIYNLQGQRLSSLQKGLNIVNGQKIYVK